jgi:hypothetical protein
MTGKGMIRNITGSLTLLLFIIGMAVPFSAVSVQAADYVMHVDGTGNDTTGDGSMGAPWRSIRKALTEIPALNMTMADNLVIYVGLGNYSVANGEEDSASTYEITTPNIAIKGSGSGSYIDGSGLANWSTGFTILADNITITEFQFYGFSGSGVAITNVQNAKVMGCMFQNNGYGVRMTSTTVNMTPEIWKNTISDSTYNGILVEASGAGFDLSPMIKMNDILRSKYHGIALMAMSGTSGSGIYGNTISDNDYSGIYMWADMGTVNPKISSNKITGNRTGIYVGGGYGSAAPVIRNNLIRGPHPTTQEYGIQISMPMSGSVTPEILHNTVDGGGITPTGINIPNSPNVIPVIRFNIISNFSQYGIYNEQTGAPDIDYNDVFNNAVGDYYNFDPAGTGNISADPLYETDYSIPLASPCINAVPAAEENALPYPVLEDIIGTTRPRSSGPGQSLDFDMGCYEYPYQEFTFTMPGGTGLSSDYRLMTVPLSDFTGSSILKKFETAFGPYDPNLWRIFAYVKGSDPAEYMEIDDTMLAEYFPSFYGSAFWVISRSGAFSKEDTVFGGGNAANKWPFSINLDAGWNLVALPWSDDPVNEDIQLANVMVEGIDAKHYLLDAANALTQQGVWAYGSTGYTELTKTSDVLQIGQGYWIYAAYTGVKLVIPPDNSGDYFAVGKVAKPNKGRAIDKRIKGLTPPQPPGTGFTAEGGNGCFIGSVY